MESAAGRGIPPPPDREFFDSAGSRRPPRRSVDPPPRSREYPLRPQRWRLFSEGQGPLISGGGTPIESSGGGRRGGSREPRTQSKEQFLAEVAGRGASSSEMWGESQQRSLHACTLLRPSPPAEMHAVRIQECMDQKCLVPIRIGSSRDRVLVVAPKWDRQQMLTTQTVRSVLFELILSKNRLGTPPA